MEQKQKTRSNESQKLFKWLSITIEIPNSIISLKCHRQSTCPCRLSHACFYVSPISLPPPHTYNCNCSHDIISPKVCLFCHKPISFCIYFYTLKVNRMRQILRIFFQYFSSLHNYLYFIWLSNTWRHENDAYMWSWMQNYTFVKNLPCQICWWRMETHLGSIMKWNTVF